MGWPGALARVETDRYPVDARVHDRVRRLDGRHEIVDLRRLWIVLQLRHGNLLPWLLPGRLLLDGIRRLGLEGEGGIRVVPRRPAQGRDEVRDLAQPSETRDQQDRDGGRVGQVPAPRSVERDVELRAPLTRELERLPVRGHGLQGEPVHRLDPPLECGEPWVGRGEPPQLGGLGRGGLARDPGHDARLHLGRFRSLGNRSSIFFVHGVVVIPRSPRSPRGAGRPGAP